jgi:predicted nucleic acid-binding protein
VAVVHTTHSEHGTRRTGETIGEALERMIGGYDPLDFAADAEGSEPSTPVASGRGRWQYPSETRSRPARTSGSNDPRHERPGCSVRGTSGTEALTTELESDGLPARIPTPVVFEACDGIGGADDPDELLPRYEALFASKPRVESADRVARRGGRLYARHEASDEKRRLDLVDAMVAAIGLDLGEPVATTDRACGDVDWPDVRPC